MALDQHALADRIRKAREGCRLTREQMAQSAGIPCAEIARIERGQRAVSSRELSQIAYSVGRDLRDFFEPEFEQRDALSALFRSDPKLSSEQLLLPALQKCVALGHQISNLERMLGMGRDPRPSVAYDTPEPRTRRDAIDQGEAIATAERRRLGLGCAPAGHLPTLLESLGARTGALCLPDNISGLTLCDKRVGIFILTNAQQPALRRRFSYAHEYAHVLIDRNQHGALSRPENRQSLIEVRANAFAAALLMPSEGVRSFLQALDGDGSGPPLPSAREGNQAIERDPANGTGSRKLDVQDVARLALHFGVSRLSMLYRLKNLGLVNGLDLRRLHRQNNVGDGRVVAESPRVSNAEQPLDAGEDFRRRFLALAFEAHRREEITRSKLTELAAMIDVGRSELQNALESADLG